MVNCLGGEFVAGAAMKEIGTTHWSSPNAEATNYSGFTSLPGSFRYLNGPFGIIGNNGYWWTSTESEINATNAWFSFMGNQFSYVNETVDSKLDGFSVRCIRD